MSEPGALLQIVATTTGWHLDGEIDAHSAPALAEAMTTLPPGDVLLEVAGVAFMDSSGLRVLVDASARAAATGGRLVLVGPTAAVMRIVEISGLQDHLILQP